MDQERNRARLEALNIYADLVARSDLQTTNDSVGENDDTKRTHYIGFKNNSAVIARLEIIYKRKDTNSTENPEYVYHDNR